MRSTAGSEIRSPRIGRQPEPPGRQSHGRDHVERGLEPKRLELLHNVVPKATTIGAIVNWTNPNAETQSRELQAAARALGLKLHILDASTERDFDTVFTKLPAVS
jgi:putative tryptophan/tyrosine transport system substrate-binding protein